MANKDESAAADAVLSILEEICVTQQQIAASLASLESAVRIQDGYGMIATTTWS